ncbi:hypothetical protein RCL1_005124 [Eukaryota sp. TZLM3-RCL]
MSSDSLLPTSPFSSATFKPMPRFDIPNGYHKNQVKSSNPIWDMCKIKNKTSSTNMDIWCSGCNVEFPKTNSSRWTSHLTSCKGWVGTKELSTFLNHKSQQSARLITISLEKQDLLEATNAVVGWDDSIGESNNFFPPKQVEDMICRLVLLLLIKFGISFAIVDSELFCELMTKFAQVHRAKQVSLAFTGPNRKSLVSEHLPKLLSETKKCVATNLLPYIPVYSYELSIDGYSTKTSPRHNIIIMCHGRSYYLGCIPTLTVCADAVHLASVVLFAKSEVDKMILSNKDENLQGLVEQPKLLEVASRIIWLTMDGAAVNDAAVEEVKKELPQFYIFSNHCITHSINLLLKDFLKHQWVNDLIAPVKTLISVFKNHSQVASMLKEAGGAAIKSFPVTRFAYFIITLKRLIDSLPTMRIVVNGIAYQTKIERTATAQTRQKLLDCKDIVDNKEPYRSFWNDSKVLLSVASPFFNILRISDQCCSGFTSFAHFAFTTARGQMKRKFFETTKRINDEEDNCVYSRETVEFRIAEFDVDVSDRIRYISTQGVIIARLLNPSLRLKNVELFSNPLVVQPLKDFLRTILHYSNELLDELNLYISKPTLFEKEAESKAPHEWWSEVGSSRFPHLAQVAARIVQSTGSSSLTERQWSMLDYQFDKRRLRMSDENMDAVMNIQYNYPALTQQPRLMTLTAFKSSIFSEESSIMTELQIHCEKRSIVDTNLLEADSFIDSNDVILDLDLGSDEEDVVNDTFPQHEEEVPDLLVEPVNLLEGIDEDMDEELLLACVSSEAGKKRKKNGRKNAKKKN